MDEDRMAQIEEGMRDAAQSTTDLRLSVESLTVLAGEVATLQRQQVETRRKAEAADVKAVTAEQRADQVDIATAARIQRSKRVGVLIAFGLVALLLLASFLTFRSAVLYVQDLTQQVEVQSARADLADRQSRYASCVTRNKAVQAQASRERRLAALPGISRDEATIHADSATELAQLAVDCNQYRKAP